MQGVYNNYKAVYSPSSSSIVTITSPESLTVTLAGSDDESIIRLKVSLLSDTSSFIIATSNETLVSPGVNVTLYGTEP